MAHAHRKFFDPRIANKSQLAEQALHSIGGVEPHLYPTAELLDPLTRSN